METLLSIDKIPDETIRFGFYENNKCSILTIDKIIIFDVKEKTSTMYTVKKHYDDISYCKRLNCYYAIVFNDNRIYKLDPDFEILFSILVNDISLPLKDIYYDCNTDCTILTDNTGVTEILSNKIDKINNDERILSCIYNNTEYYLIIDNNDYYIVNNNLMYKLPSDYKYNSILDCNLTSDLNNYNIVLSAENKSNYLILSINSNELSYNNDDLLFTIAKEERKLADDLYIEADKAATALKSSLDIYDLIHVNTTLQAIIDDIIVEEYMLYKKTYNIINGT